MRRRGFILGVCALAAVAAGRARAQGTMIDNFSGDAAQRWEFISDQVMGGVSTGRASFERANGGTVLHLSGKVSTANNGGFIQARRKLQHELPASAQGVALRLRGNGERYYLHARTGGTVLPWNFYQAPFETTTDWADVRVPFSTFEAQGRMLRKELKAGAVSSLAVVAYGRDHEADLEVAQIGYY